MHPSDAFVHYHHAGPSLILVIYFFLFIRLNFLVEKKATFDNIHTIMILIIICITIAIISILL